MLELYLYHRLFGIGSYINKSKESTIQKIMSKKNNNNVKKDSNDKPKKDNKKFKKIKKCSRSFTDFLDETKKLYELGKDTSTID